MASVLILFTRTQMYYSNNPMFLCVLLRCPLGYPIYGFLKFGQVVLIYRGDAGYTSVTLHGNSGADTNIWIILATYDVCMYVW